MLGIQTAAPPMNRISPFFHSQELKLNDTVSDGFYKVLILDSTNAF